VITELLEDEEDIELANFLAPEETLDKVKTDDLFRGGIRVKLENEVCVASGASALAVQI